MYVYTKIPLIHRHWYCWWFLVHEKIHEYSISYPPWKAIAYPNRFPSRIHCLISMNIPWCSIGYPFKMPWEIIMFSMFFPWNALKPPWFPFFWGDFSATDRLDDGGAPWAGAAHAPCAQAQGLEIMWLNRCSKFLSYVNMLKIHV